MSRKIKKILIANRGEIAIRIIRTCREMGFETVSVHSEADNDSIHVKMADESVCIGPAKSQFSYLNIPSILSAAEITNADAIHPGYGFLSENEDFAVACDKWGVQFIGPNAECIRKMGDKIYSKKMAKEAGIPTLEPICVASMSDEEILSHCRKLTFPVLIKASAGGGGRGMKKIEKEEELFTSLTRMYEEAKAAFGDGTLFIEKYISNPRHIEVQILADKHGNVIHLGERDCTIQRRFQKILEEAPSPVLTDKTRSEICECAVKIAKHVGYDSVGTVEFIYDLDSKKFYFMEMNTRIQVEHPVTEELVGVDLVRQQILVAQGNPLELKQSDIKFNGHVIEMRLNAEDPITSRPCPGLISHYHRPGGMGIRVDDYIYTGYSVPPYYDSMVSKVIVKAQTRELCILRCLRALRETVIGGIDTNIELHKKILLDSDFQKNNYSTHFISQKIR